MDWRDEWIRRWKEEGLSEDEFPWDELPIVHDSDVWEVRRCWRRTACDNRPGLGRFYINVKDENGGALGNVRIGFDTEPGDSGTIYDHPDIWGWTGTRRGREGYAEWDHFGIPTRYMMYVDGELLIENIRADLGNEYCQPGSVWNPSGWRPVNRPGVYSYTIELQRKGM